MISQQAIEFIDTFKNWIAGGAVTLCIWFIVHFVKQREKFEDKVDKFKEGVKKETDEFKNNVNKKIEDALDKVEAAAIRLIDQVEKAKQVSDSMTRTAYEFQEKLLRDLSRVQVDLQAISGQIRNVESISETTSNKVSLLYEQVDSIQTKVAAHANSLGLGAIAIDSFRKDISKMKSEVVQISNDIVLIRNKKH